MNAKIDQLYHEALTLPVNERATLAAQLMDSLDPAADQDVQAAWEAEIRKRINELDSGKVKPIPWEQARRIILGLSNESGTS